MSFNTRRLLAATLAFGLNWTILKYVQLHAVLVTLLIFFITAAVFLFFGAVPWKNKQLDTKPGVNEAHRKKAGKKRGRRA